MAEPKEPTDAQKAAGNYLKGHRALHGMRISIENEAGSTRRGTNKKTGEAWESVMPHDYGYVRGSKGKDKDHIDVFLGPEADNPDHPVFVIDQDDDEGNFDEHKAMIGFPDANSAYEGYHDAYPEGHQGFRAITALPLSGFRQWAGMGVAGGKRKRISELAGLDAYRKGGAVTAPAEAARIGSTGSGAGVSDPATLQEHFAHAAAGAPDDDCGCGNGIQMPAERSSSQFVSRSFADGGAVGGGGDGARGDEIDLTQPYRGVPLIARRRQDRQDREGAKEVPLQLLRGAIAGTLGFGGDVEGIGRTAANLLGADVDSKPTLPTGDFYQEALPLRPASATGKAAGSVGSLAGVPLSVATTAGVRAASKAAPAVRGALSQLAENAMAPTQLSSQAGAIRLPNIGSGRARPLTEVLDELGWTDDPGVMQDILNVRDKTVRSISPANPHGVEHGFERGAADEGNRPIAVGDGSSVRIPRRHRSSGLDQHGYEEPNAFESLLNVHSHPVNSSPLPSFEGNAAGGGMGDIEYWNRLVHDHITDDNSLTGLVIRPQRTQNGFGYTLRVVPGQSDVMEPEIFGEGIGTIERAIKGGAFDSSIRDAMEAQGVDPMLDKNVQMGRNFAMNARGFLPHAYFDSANHTRSAFDMSNDMDMPGQLLGTRYGNVMMQRLWPAARDVLGNHKFAGGYAQGGSIAAGNTVGVGTYDPSRQGVQSQGQQQPVGVNTGSGAGGTPGSASSGSGDIATFGQIAGGPPTVANNLEMGKGGAPIYSDKGLDDYITGYKNPFGVNGKGLEAMDPGITTTLLAGNQGHLANGANAFLGTYDPVRMEMDTAAEGGIYKDHGDGYAPAWSLANQMGLAGKYAGLDDATMWSRLNDDLKDYYTLSGMSSGWDGKPTNARGASNVMYKRQNGKLVPVTKPQGYTAAENPGFWKGNDGRALLSAVSVMAPAFGGWAGLAGQTAGTAGATAANIGGNAAMGYLQNGSQGALSSLAGGLGGWAGATAAPALGASANLGSQVGSQAGKYLYQQTQDRT